MAGLDAGSSEGNLTHLEMELVHRIDRLLTGVQWLPHVGQFEISDYGKSNEASGMSQDSDWWIKNTIECFNLGYM